MPRKQKPSCILCEDPATISEFCDACYHSLYYWRNRTPTEMVERMRKLDKYRRRMEFRLGGNVTTTKAAPKGAAKKKSSSRSNKKKGAA